MQTLVAPSANSTHKILCTRSPRAAECHSGIVAILEELLDRNYPSCLDRGFLESYSDVLRLYDEYQQELQVALAGPVTCRRGCSRCCCHWVEDVYSFETEIVATYICQQEPSRIPAIIKRLSDDCAAFERLDRTLQVESTDDDPIDRLLFSFHRLQRRCPLLDRNGNCSIYPVRPITCRSYVSLTPPQWCDPQYQGQEESTTFMLDFGEEAASLLDELHFRFLRFGDDTGLRSLLLKYLMEAGQSVHCFSRKPRM